MQAIVLIEKYAPSNIVSSYTFKTYIRSFLIAAEQILRCGVSTVQILNFAFVSVNDDDRLTKP